MAKRKIIWTLTAARQRRSILAYWVKHNTSNSYSLKLLKANNAKAESIAKNPEMFRMADFPGTHVASMGHFSIFYKYNADEIIITAFWDNRQDPAKLLRQLKSDF